MAVSERRGARMRGRALLALAISAAVSGAAACSNPVNRQELPPDVQDPEAIHTPSGLLGRYRGALFVMPPALDWYLGKTAAFTDELAGLPMPFGVSNEYTPIDMRRLQADFDEDYNRLHQVRGQARETRGLLTQYGGDSLSPLAGHMYLLEAYAEILLADLFCSGIPLSTVDYNGDYTLAPGSTTSEVYEHAITLIDSAAPLLGDSARFRHLAAVGRGRALLALGRYADAGAAVAAVPDGYAYQLVFDPKVTHPPGRFVLRLFEDRPLAFGLPSIGDHEGLSGLDYLSSNDPRIGAQVIGLDTNHQTLVLPAKYLVPDIYGSHAVTLTLASGVEARLIEAEAALQAPSGEWLTKINMLRTDGTYDTQPNATDPSKTDTLWHAGSGGVAGLGPLADPGDPTARVDLLFRERAFWLYMTGERQGDLRRLIRRYGRQPDMVYPHGSYPGGQSYGSEVTAPVPDNERNLNPKYAGCFHHSA